MTVDQSLQLTALVPPAPGKTTPAIMWTSSDIGVAIVTKTGVLFGLKSGRATITATAGGYSDATVVTVKPGIRDIDFESDSLAISLAESVKIPYRVTDTTATRSISASKGGVELHGSRRRRHDVRRDRHGSRHRQCRRPAARRNRVAKTGVRVLNKPVASVFASPSSLALSTGQTAQLVATTYDVNGDPISGRSISWASSNAAVASVSSSGLVTTIASGNAEITANAGGRKTFVPVAVSASSSSNVVSAPVASVVVALNASTLLAGQSTQATATLKDASGNVLTGRSIVWTSSEVTIASVNATGLVTALKGGAVTITAASEGKSGGASLITAMPAATATPVSFVTLTVAPSINVGQTAQASVTLKDNEGNILTDRSIAYVSSDANIASISPSGLVAALKGGGVTITASSEGKSANAVVTSVAPKPAASSITLTVSAPSINIGQATQINAVVKDVNGTPISGVPVTWSSSPSAVATVSSSGMASGLNAGSATIYAKVDAVTSGIGITVIDPATPISPVPPPVSDGRDDRGYA